MDGCQVGLDECYGDRAPKLHDVVVCASLFVSGLGEKCGQCCRGEKHRSLLDTRFSASLLRVYFDLHC